MIRKLILMTFSLIAFGCAGTSKAPQVTQTPAILPGTADGCFLLYNMKTNKFEKIVGEERCRKQLPACSTFKIPLAVIAFDSGALKDENQVLKWDGKKDVREVANQDHNAKSWMRDSIVWFSQRITPKLGPAKFQAYLDKFEYGNKDIKGGLTNAWLVSPSSDGPALKISAYEQVDFMKKLWSNQLPASERAMRLTREITYLETSPSGFQLSGKTGSNYYDKEQKVRLGWFVSHIQKGEQEYIAVTSFNDLSPTDDKGYGGLTAKELTKQFLAVSNLW